MMIWGKVNCRLLLIITLILWGMIGCRRVGDTLYVEYADISPEGWSPAEPIDFNPMAADSTYIGRPMNLILCVRYRIHKPMALMPILISIENESETIVNDTLLLRTFHHNGEPVGKGGMGIAEISDTVLHGFTYKGPLKVRTTPLLPPKSSEGLLNIGIKLTDHEPISSHL